MDTAWLEHKALDYVARWESTRRGVAELLERKIRQRCDRTNEQPETPLALIPEIVERLVARDYVNDQRAASQLFERLRQQGRSRSQIRFRLLQKGVPESITSEFTRLHDADAELQAAWKTARRRGLGPHCRDPERRSAERTRHLSVLARQGFSCEIAHRVIDAKETTPPFESRE